MHCSETQEAQNSMHDQIANTVMTSISKALTAQGQAHRPRRPQGHHTLRQKDGRHLARLPRGHSCLRPGRHHHPRLTPGMQNQTTHHHPRIRAIRPLLVLRRTPRPRRQRSRQTEPIPQHIRT
eukprot:1795647-Rhodomonas_salina.2